MNVRMVAGSATVQRTGRPAAASTARRRAGLGSAEMTTMVPFSSAMPMTQCARTIFSSRNSLAFSGSSIDFESSSATSVTSATALANSVRSAPNFSTVSANCNRSPLALDSACARLSALICSRSTSSWPTFMHSAAASPGTTGASSRGAGNDGASGESFVFWNSAIVPVSRQWGRIPAHVRMTSSWAPMM